MDVQCKKCQEPYDVLDLHENVLDLPFGQARQEFFRNGCGRLFGTDCQPITPTDKIIIQSVLEEVLGDDIDGLAAMMEDYDAFAAAWDRQVNA